MTPSLQFPTALQLTPGRNRQLRQLIETPGLLSAPGVFDCLTARLVETAGYQAAYVTGSGMSISRLGAPDVGFMSFAEVRDQIARIADVTKLPIIVDADTGFGGPLNVIRTVRELEKAGASAIQIEDQEEPKRCGHELGRRIVSTEIMVDRIKAAVDTRNDSDMVVVARTDARTSEGLQAALSRASCYAEAGADVIFVESPESEEEMRKIVSQLNVPALANLVEGGRTPMMPAKKLHEIGYRIAIYPNSLTRLFGRMGQELLAVLREEGTTASMTSSMLTHRELWDLFDYPAWLALEARYPYLASGVPQRSAILTRKVELP